MLTYGFKSMQYWKMILKFFRGYLKIQLIASPKYSPKSLPVVPVFRRNPMVAARWSSRVSPIRVPNLPQLYFYVHLFSAWCLLHLHISLAYSTLMERLFWKLSKQRPLLKFWVLLMDKHLSLKRNDRNNQHLNKWQNIKWTHNFKAFVFQKCIFI